MLNVRANALGDFIDRRGQVNSSHLFQGDDDDDSKLFRKAEEHVLEHFPNPNRRGCPGPAILRAFVESPEQIELSDLCGLHILRCAECTRDLIELRREREMRLGQRPTVHSGSRWRRILFWLALFLAAGGTIAAIWFFPEMHRASWRW